MTFRFDHETARGLVMRCREDWDLARAEGPLARVRTLGWDDRKVSRVLMQVLQDDDATPDDLARAVDRDHPVARPAGGVSPEANPEFTEARAIVDAAAAAAKARTAQSAREAGAA